MVLHNHGRKSESEDFALSRLYAMGRGGLYCKHILRADLKMASIAADEIYGLSKTLLKGFMIRKDFPPQNHAPRRLKWGYKVSELNFQTRPSPQSFVIAAVIGFSPFLILDFMYSVTKKVVGVLKDSPGAQYTFLLRSLAELYPVEFRLAQPGKYADLDALLIFTGDHGAGMAAAADGVPSYVIVRQGSLGPRLIMSK